AGDLNGMSIRNGAPGLQEHSFLADLAGTQRGKEQRLSHRAKHVPVSVENRDAIEFQGKQATRSAAGVLDGDAQRQIGSGLQTLTPVFSKIDLDDGTARPEPLLQISA